VEGHFFGCHAVHFALGFSNESESFKREFLGFVAHPGFFNDGADIGQSTVLMFVR
jgi:hypothetical protein